MWSILPEIGAVRLRNASPGQLPWTCSGSRQIEPEQDIVVFPRDAIRDDDLAVASGLVGDRSQLVGLLVPSDSTERPLPDKIALMVFPDTAKAIDGAIERRLLNSRVGRT